MLKFLATYIILSILIRLKQITERKIDTYLVFFQRAKSLAFIWDLI